MNKLYSVLFVIISIISLYPQQKYQTIRGIVLDADAKTPLIGANVVVVKTSPSLGASTNEKGEFVIANVPIGRHSLQCSYMGYNATTMPEVLVGSGKEVSVTFHLKESVVSSQEIVVKAETVKNKASNPMADVSARSFSVEESRRYAGAMDDPLRAVSSFAGVTGSGDVNSNGIVVRGNSPKGLLWRLEDVDIPNPNHFSYVGQSGGGVTIFSSQVLANSDFYTSAFPGEYGNALSGVFDMKFRNGNSNKHEYTAQAGISGAEFASEGPAGFANSSYLCNYRYSVYGFLQMIDPTMKNKIPSYQDVSFKVVIPTDSYGKFTIFGIGGLSRSKYLPDYSPTQTSNEDRQRSVLDNDMGAAGLSHTLVAGNATIIKTTLSATTNRVHYWYGYNDSGTLYYLNQSEYRNSRWAVNSYINHKFSSAYTNKTGITLTRLYYHVNLKATDVFTGSYSGGTDDNGYANLLQAYTESKIDFSNSVNMNIGLYYQTLSVADKASLEPRASLSWNFAAGQSFGLGYGLHSQAEDICIYRLQKTMPGGSVYYPNKNLSFGKAHHFVVSYDYAFDPDKRIKVELYRQQLFDIPVVANTYYSMLNNPGGYFNDPLVNVGKGYTQGVDITVEKFLTENFYYLVTGSYYTAKYKGGDGVERNGRYNGKYVVNFLFGKEFTTASDNIFGINLKVSYTGGEYYIPVDVTKSIAAGNEILDESQIYTQHLPGFCYVDLSVSYRINYQSSALILALQIKNALNQKPVIGYSYNSYLKSVDTNKPMGIIPMINCKYEF